MSDWKPPPGTDEPAQIAPEPFHFSLVDAGDVWTDDAKKIQSMSDAPIVEGLLREHEVGTVVGAAKTAKTWFSLGLALAVASGEDFLGMRTYRRKVLYLDYELKPGTFAKRLSMLAPARPIGFHFQCLRGEARLPSVKDIETLVRERGFGLVIVDSLYRTGWISEENSNDSTSRDLTCLQRLTRETPCSLLCVDHTAKGGGSERSAVDAARGASAKGGFYDALLVLRSTDEGPDPEGTYAILDPVLRDWRGFDKLPLVSFAWTASSCEISHAGDCERGAGDAITGKIMDVLAEADDWMKFADIERKMDGTKETSIRRAIKKLVRDGKVIESPDPAHIQRKIYRLRDMADEPRQTTPNHAA